MTINLRELYADSGEPDDTDMHPTVALMTEHAKGFITRAARITEKIHGERAYDGQDHYQDVIVRVLKQPDQFTGDMDGMEGFMRTSTRRAALSSYQRARKIPMFGGDSLDYDIPSHDDPGNDTSDIIDAVELVYNQKSAATGRADRKKSARRQIAAFIATQVDQQTYEQVSVRHGVPFTTTRKDVYFARQKLKQLFASEENLLNLPQAIDDGDFKD